MYAIRTLGRPYAAYGYTRHACAHTAYGRVGIGATQAHGLYPGRVYRLYPPHARLYPGRMYRLGCTRGSTPFAAVSALPPPYAALPPSPLY